MTLRPRVAAAGWLLTALLLACWVTRDFMVAYLLQPVPPPSALRWPLNAASKLGQLAIPTLLGMAIALRVVLPTTAARKALGLILLLACWVISVSFGPRMGHLGVDSLREVFSANWMEAREFLAVFVLTPGYRPRDIILSMLPGAIVAAGGLLTRTGDQERRRLRLWFAGLVGLLLSLLAFGVTHYALEQRDEERIAASMERNALSLQQQVGALPAKPINVVLYIGESTSALHQSLLGYPRPTNAPLKSLGDELIVFRDVFSVHSFTREVLLRALSVSQDPLLDQLTPDRDLQRANVVTLLTRAGVHTHWLSNQSRAGSWDLASQIYGKAAQSSQFLNFEIANTIYDQRRFDHELLPLFGQALQRSQGSNLFVLHSYAGHHDYCRNIPPAARLSYDDAQARTSWTGLFGLLSKRDPAVHRQDIDCYDSAVTYTSKNLAEVAAMVRAHPTPTLLIYMPDHGEDPLGGTSHDAGMSRFSHLAIPLYLYGNPAAQREHAVLLANARSHTHTPYSLAWMADTLLDAFGLRLKQREMVSLFSRELNPPARYALLRHELLRGSSHVSLDRAGESLVDRSDDTTKLSRLMRSLDEDARNRLCVHRADTLYKFLTTTFVARCAEVDIVVDSQSDEVWVFHPPRENPKLPLAALLEAGGAPLRRVWLDVKTSDGRSLDKLAAALQTLRQRHPTLQFLVEIQPQAALDEAQQKALARLRGIQGVQLSHYLSSSSAEACPNGARTLPCQAAIDLVEQNLKLGRFDAVSFDASLLALARQLPSYAKLQRHVWGEVPRPSPKDLEFNTVLLPVETDFDY